MGDTHAQPRTASSLDGLRGRPGRQDEHSSTTGTESLPGNADLLKRWLQAQKEERITNTTTQMTRGRQRTSSSSYAGRGVTKPILGRKRSQSLTHIHVTPKDLPVNRDRCTPAKLSKPILGRERSQSLTHIKTPSSSSRPKAKLSKPVLGRKRSQSLTPSFKPKGPVLNKCNPAKLVLSRERSNSLSSIRAQALKDVLKRQTSTEEPLFYKSFSTVVLRQSIVDMSLPPALDSSPPRFHESLSDIAPKFYQSITEMYDLTKEHNDSHSCASSCTKLDKSERQSSLHRGMEDGSERAMQCPKTPSRRQAGERSHSRSKDKSNKSPRRVESDRRRKDRSSSRDRGKTTSSSPRKSESNNKGTPKRRESGSRSQSRTPKSKKSISGSSSKGRRTQSSSPKRRIQDIVAQPILPALGPFPSGQESFSGLSFDAITFTPELADEFFSIKKQTMPGSPKRPTRGKGNKNSMSRSEGNNRVR